MTMVVVRVPCHPHPDTTIVLGTILLYHSWIPRPLIDVTNLFVLVLITYADDTCLLSVNKDPTAPSQTLHTHITVLE